MARCPSGAPSHARYRRLDARFVTSLVPLRLLARSGETCRPLRTASRRSTDNQTPFAAAPARSATRSDRQRAICPLPSAMTGNMPSALCPDTQRAKPSALTATWPLPSAISSVALALDPHCGPAHQQVAWVADAASRIRGSGAGRALRCPPPSARREVRNLARSPQASRAVRRDVSAPAHGFALQHRQPRRPSPPHPLAPRSAMCHLP